MCGTCLVCLVASCLESPLRRSREKEKNALLLLELTTNRGASINLVLDLIIYALPARLIYNLKIAKSQKRALMLVFSFGAL